MQLYEEQRPDTWDKLVGQDHVVKRISALQRRGLSGRVFMLVGGSGCGKTTVARLIAKEVAADFQTEEIDAQDLNIDLVREFERRCHIRPLLGDGYCFIVNESYSLNYTVVRRLQTVLENPFVQKNSVWIFTATPAGQKHFLKLHTEGAAFLSRCIQIEMNSGESLLEPFARRCRQIAQAAELDGRPLEDYLTLARDCQSNFRQMLQRVDAGEML